MRRFVVDVASVEYDAGGGVMDAFGGLRSRIWIVQLGRWKRAVAMARPMPDAGGG
jgi:hypothetical protein